MQLKTFHKHHFKIQMQECVCRKQEVKTKLPVSCTSPSKCVKYRKSNFGFILGVCTHPHEFSELISQPCGDTEF